MFPVIFVLLAHLAVREDASLIALEVVSSLADVAVSHLAKVTFCGNCSSFATEKIPHGQQ